MDRVSVVIVPGSPAGEAVRATMESWTRSGISTPVLVVGAPDIVDASPEPVEVTAQLLDRQGEHRVDLFAFLGRYRLDLVRIVLVQLLPKHEDADPELSCMAATVAATVQASLPLDPTGRPITRLHRTVLVIPASGVEGASCDILLPAWDANVVISPEDRADVDRPSMFVRAIENFAGHAAASIGAAAGVIRGIPDGAFDAVTTDSSTRVDDIVVARVSIRAVVGEEVLDFLVPRVLDPSLLAPVGPALVLSNVRAASEPDLVISRATNAVLTSPDWAPSRAPLEETPSTSVSRSLSSLGEAARFNLRTTAAVVAWTVTRGRNHLSSVATEALVGTGVGSIVTVGPRAVDRVGEVAAAVVDEQRRALDERLTFEATRGSPPPPGTWRQLRDLAFGLADGGPVEGVGELVQLGAREVLVPQDVVPHPEDALVIPEDRVLMPYDPMPARSYREELADRLRSLRRTLRDTEADLAAIRTGLTPLTPDATPPSPLSASAAPVAPGLSSTDPAPPGAPDAEGESADRTAETHALDQGPSTPDGASVVPAPAPAHRAAPESPAPRTDHPGDPRQADLERHVAQVQAELERQRLELTALEAHELEYLKWFDRVSGSVLWRVGEDLAGRLHTMERSRQRFLDSRGDVAAPATESLEKAKRRLLRIWWWTVPVTILAIAALLLVVNFAFEDPDWGLVLGIAAAIVALAIVLLIVANQAFYKAFRRYEWEVARVLARQRYDSERYLWAGKELVRLRVLLSGWKDWAVIIGEVLHRTWEPPVVAYDELPEDVVERLPAAVAVARHEGELDLPPSLLVRAYQEPYRTGWATQAFDVAYAQFATRLPGDERSGYLQADTDTISTQLSPRGQLLEFWSSGEGRALTGQWQYERLRRLAHDGELDLPDRVVRRIGPFSDGARISEPDYFAPTTSCSTTFALDVFGTRARTENRHYVHRTRIWLPRAARSSGQQSGTVEPDDDETGGARSAEVRIDQATASTAVRVDISRRIQPSALTLFAFGGSASPSSGPPTPLAEPDGPDSDRAWGSASTGFV